MSDFTKNWMSYLDGNKKLTDLTIPGTHDTGTWTKRLSIAERCQNMTLENQLNNGVRFLDIRLKAIKDKKDELVVYHGGNGYTGLKFTTDIMDVCKAFLQLNKNESIIMSIKDESKTEHREQAFYEKVWGTIRSYQSIFYTEDAIPDLKSVRGKIILLRRFWAPGGLGFPVGINIRDNEPGSAWPDGDAGDKGTNVWTNLISKINFYVQDKFAFFGADVKDKFRDHVKPALEDAAKKEYKDYLFLNFTSCTGRLVPRDIAGQVNPLFFNYLKSNSGRFGIIPMDIPEYPNNGQLIQSLIFSNDFKRNNQKPLFRYCSKQSDHLYITNQREVANNITYNFEGVTGLVYAEEDYKKLAESLKSKLTPLYRYYNDNTKQHFYITNPNEHPDNYIAEGPVCYIFKENRAGLVPLFRLRNDDGSKHLYTTSNIEVNHLKENKWTLEGDNGIGYLSEMV